MSLKDVALPQETVTVDGEEYLFTAMPATAGLQFMEKHQAAMDSGKPDLSLLKLVVTKYVVKDSMAINEAKFDILFARKLGHLRNVFDEYFQYNFGDVFTQPDSEE